jgi:hypothetical protein
VANIKTAQLVCRAQKQEVHEDGANAVSRRLALTVLIGAAAIGSKVSPADAAYGEAGNFAFFLSSMLSVYPVPTNHIYQKAIYCQWYLFSCSV